MEQGAGESVFSQSEFINMVSEALCTPIEQIWRVKINDNGAVDMYSFALPQPEKNLHIGTRLNDLPQWIKERISVLQICEQGDIVDGVGQKLSDKVFYVIE
jgi:hypothetical protein